MNILHMESTLPSLIYYTWIQSIASILEDDTLNVYIVASFGFTFTYLSTPIDKR